MKRLIPLLLLPFLPACSGTSDPGQLSYVSPTPDTESSDNSPSIDFDEKNGWATEYTVLLDPNLSQGNIGMIISSLYDWQTVVPVHFSNWIGSCNQSQEGQICVHAGAAEFPNGGGPGQSIPNILGFTSWSNDHADVYLYDVSDSYDMQVMVALHELGHAMGLIHHSGPYIMNPTLPSVATNLTADDANQWFSIHGLPTIPEDAGRP